MRAKTKNLEEIDLRELRKEDYEQLATYLNQLSQDTKNRFGPHAYDLKSIHDFYSLIENKAYIAINNKNEIIGYAILKKGFLMHDCDRLSSYGLQLSKDQDCTFAPSVADAYQSQGVGQLLFDFILDKIKASETNRIILWGGVQKQNERAVKFYKKNGFQEIGEFEYYGWNIDMYLELK